MIKNAKIVALQRGMDGETDKDRIKCRLDNGMDAFVNRKDLQISREQDLGDIYQIGAVLTGRICDLQITAANGKQCVHLSCLPGELENHKKYAREVPPQFVVNEADDFVNHTFMASNKDSQNAYVRRKINHPAFKNIRYMDSIEFLKNKDIGEYVFRPSSRGVNNLNATWKFYNNTYVHLDISEEQKAPGANIGSLLRISNEEFSTIQEVIDRYILPCAKYVKEAINHAKFLTVSTLKEMEDFLITEKKKDLNIIPYKFCIVPEYPQHIVICYIPKKLEMKKEFIKVKPRGYYFHDKFHTPLNTLV